MNSVLLKKDLASLLNGIFFDAQKGRKRSAGMVILYLALYVWLFGIFGGISFMMFSKLSENFVPAGLGWFYLIFAVFIGFMISIIGSAYMTYSMLYNGKDNELLLSMPLKPSQILMSRMVSVYTVSFVFNAVILLPALILYWRNALINPGIVLYQILLMFVVPMLSFSVGCLLGWVIAILSSRMRHKNIVSVVCALVFLGLYMYYYTKFISNLTNALSAIMGIAESVRGVEVIYQFGLGLTGEIIPAIVIVAGCILIFFAVCLVLNSNYLSILTTNRGAKKIKYDRTKEMKVASRDSALLKRELTHLVSSPTYMLNCMLGSFFTIIAIVAVFIKKADILGALAVFGLSELSEALLAACVGLACMVIGSMSMITAPSVSIEGKTLWVLKTLPVTTKDIFKSKLMLGIVTSTVPTVAFSLVGSIYLLNLSFVGIIKALVISVLWSILLNLFGLMMGIVFPNLSWTNESYAVKQGMAVLGTLFVGMIGAVVFALVLFFSGIDAVIILWASIGLFALLDVLIYLWISTMGVKKFDAL